MKIKRYVAGFLFSPDHTKVTLIRKNKPPRQAGRFNGIGGSVEDGENFIDAMTREFREEAGVTITDWELFTVYQTREYVVYFYRAFSNEIDNVTTAESEVVSTHLVTSISRIPLSRIMRNLNWLIPLALDNDVKSLIHVNGV